MDLTKNVCEVFGSSGYIGTAYTYSPYGQVTATGNVTQPIQWSSEFHDEELGLVYYNYRYYNGQNGKWIGEDLLKDIKSFNTYLYANNSPIYAFDVLGLRYKDQYKIKATVSIQWWDDDGGVSGKYGSPYIGINDQYLASVNGWYEAICDCGRLENTNSYTIPEQKSFTNWGSITAKMVLQDKRIGPAEMQVVFTSTLETEVAFSIVGDLTAATGAGIGGYYGAAGGAAGSAAGAAIGVLIGASGKYLYDSLESMVNTSSTTWSTTATFTCNDKQNQSKPHLEWGPIEPEYIWKRETSSRTYNVGYEHYVPFDRTWRF